MGGRFCGAGRGTRGGGGFEVLGTEAHGHLRAFTEPVERYARHRHEQVPVERDLPVHDPAGDGEGELHHLVLGLVNHLRAERRELVERLGQTPQHDFAALARGFGAGTLALGKPLREGVAFERRQAGVVCGPIGDLR